MEIKEYITGIGTLLSAFLVVGGWMFTRYKDREQEKFRLRQSRREELARAFLAVDVILLQTSGKVDSHPEFNRHWLNLAGLMRLYGTADESREWLRFAKAFAGENRNVADANSSRNSLSETLTNSIRSELGFDRSHRDHNIDE